MYQAKCKIRIQIEGSDHSGNCTLEADGNAFKLEIYSPIGSTVFNLYANQNWLVQQYPKPTKKIENTQQNRLALLGADITPLEVHAILWGRKFSGNQNLVWEFEQNVPKTVYKNGLVQIVRVEFQQWFEYQGQQLPKRILIQTEASPEKVQILLAITQFLPKKNSVQSF